MESLDRASSVPLYVQVRDDLQRKITSGQLRAGDLLVPEPELCERYQVSRHTLRQAIDQLVRDGLLVRHRGRGTFVTRPRVVEQPLGGFYSFAREMAQRGIPLHSQVLAQEITAPSADECKHLHLRSVEHVYRLKRLRFLEGEPLVLEVLHLPAHLGEVLLDADLTNQPVYDLLERRAGVTITHAHETIRPVVIQGADAELLRVKPGLPAFSVERLGEAGSRSVEWRESLIRGDRFFFTVELPRQQTSAVAQALTQRSD